MILNIYAFTYETIMKITINNPTEEAIAFAHEYLKQERDELPNIYESTMPSRLINPVNADKLRKGELDNTEFDIELDEFKWLHYFIIKRFLERIQETKRMLIQQMSTEMGISRQSYHDLFKTPRKSSNGGKQRRVHRSRRRVRRTHRRRA